MSQRWGLLAVVALVWALAACTEPVPGTPVAMPNTAAVDAGTTKQVLDAVTYDVENVFPLVAATDAGGWPPVVRQHLIGWAAVEVENLVRDKGNYLTTESVTIEGAGVVQLIGDHASVLVYAWLNDDITNSGAGDRRDVTLLIDMDHVGGAWRTSGVQDNPGLDPPVGAQRPPGDQYAQRDAALIAAESLATRLTVFDKADPAGSFDKWFAASVEPLTGKLHKEQDSYDEYSSCTATVDPGSIVAAVDLRPRDADVLVVLQRECDGSYTGLDSMRLRVVRTADGSWKAADLTEFGST